MANECTCTLLVIESRKLRQAIFRFNPSPPRTQNHPTLTDLFRYIVSAFGLAECGKKNHSWRGKSDTSSTFNRNRLVMETPGRIWSARRGPGSYSSRTYTEVYQCTAQASGLTSYVHGHKSVSIRNADRTYRAVVHGTLLV